MFVGKAGAYSSEAPFNCPTLGLTHKHLTKLETPAKNRYSSLLETFVNYSCKKFLNIPPWPNIINILPP
jgi:hypothetical protein